MRAGSHRPMGPTPTAEDIEGALDALDAPALRALVRELLPELEVGARTRVVRGLVERAARAGSGWTPPTVSDQDVSDALAFVEAAVRVGYAAPAEVDALLDRASRAFLRRNYAAAHRIFRAVLEALCEAQIDLGQEERVEDVLSSDLDGCAAQYAVSAYMLSAPKDRARAVLETTEITEATWFRHAPLRHMERAAIEPLPELETFLRSWRVVAEKAAAAEERGGWAGPGAWLREVAERTDGAEGLLEVARASGARQDYLAWCARLVADGDTSGALAAYEEAAASARDSEIDRADFLDGAARMAEQLGRPDVSARLERAWRCYPTMARLLRWLGSDGGSTPLSGRVRAALESTPANEERQRALLHVLAGDLAAAANLLATAPGLGWSAEQHPGPLLVPLFRAILAGEGRSGPKRGPRGDGRDREAAPDDLHGFVESYGQDRANPQAHVEASALRDLVLLAGVGGEPGTADRAVLLASMQGAAERRLAAVTGHKRRRHYDAAAELVGAVVACDPAPAVAGWAALLCETYRGHPALRAALDRHVGRADGGDPAR